MNGSSVRQPGPLFPLCALHLQGLAWIGLLLLLSSTQMISQQSLINKHRQHSAVVERTRTVS